MSDKKWMWCLHCERVYLEGEFLRDHNCPYVDCDGSVIFDGWYWNEDIRTKHPEFPVVPVKGKIYRLY